MTRKKSYATLAGLAALALAACLDRTYDNPFISENGSEIGPAWKTDRDGNGIADSVETYASNCQGTPAECLSLAWGNAQSIAKSRTDSLTLAAKGKDSASIPANPIVKAIPPRDSAINAPKDTVRLPPKDTAIATPKDTVTVPPKDTAIAPPKDTTNPPKDTAITPIPPKDTLQVPIPPRDTVRDTVIAPPKVTAATGIEAQVIYIPMGVQKARPSVSILPRDAANQGYTLQSLDEATVKVSGQDLIPVKPGSATVRARSDDGGFTTEFQANVLVSDTNRYETEVSVAPMQLVADEAAQAPVITWKPVDVTNRSYALTSADPGTVLVVMEGGVPKCKPIAAGKTDITLKTLGKGLTAVFTVTVKAAPILTIPVLSISAEDVALVLGAADIAPLAAYLPVLASNKAYTLKSGTPGIVSVSGSQLHAVAGGSSIITITSVDGPSSTFKATVTVPVDSVSVADVAMDLGAPDAAPVIIYSPVGASNKAYSMKSDNAAVVSVSGALLHAAAGGKATITLTSADGPSTTFKVAVSVPVQSISAGDLEMELGSPNVTPAIAFLPASASNKAYTLKSGNISVVTVSGAQLHAVASGTAIITVTSADGPTSTFKAKVAAAVVHVQAITAPDLDLAKGETSIIVPEFTPANPDNTAFTLSSDSPETVSVTGNEVVAEKNGKAVITMVAADGGILGSFDVTVTKKGKGGEGD